MPGVMAAQRSFVKVEGLGNDFVLLDLRGLGEEELEAELRQLRALAPRICDRRRGIGGDGILVVGPARSESAAASMIVINFDGSRPEMCGNGLRCVAAFVAGSEDRPRRLTLDTDAGSLACELLAPATATRAAQVRVDMGPASPRGTARPQSGGGRSFVGVSMGNPHAVCFVSGDEDPEILARRLGPAIELDAAYQPDKTNVEFAALHPNSTPPRIDLWVWERGVGITQACGTGACAAAAAAVLEGRLPAGVPLEVRLPGGTLEIAVPSVGGAGVSMTGPARQVFEGRIELAPPGSAA